MSEARARLQAENDALREKNDRLWLIIMLPGLEANRVLAEFPGIVAGFTPPGAGEDYRLARAWHRTIAAALAVAVEEALRKRREP